MGGGGGDRARQGGGCASLPVGGAGRGTRAPRSVLDKGAPLALAIAVCPRAASLPPLPGAHTPAAAAEGWHSGVVPPPRRGVAAHSAEARRGDAWRTDHPGEECGAAASLCWTSRVCMCWLLAPRCLPG